jgi:hypothetical protein
LGDRIDKIVSAHRQHVDVRGQDRRTIGSVEQLRDGEPGALRLKTWVNAGNWRKNDNIVSKAAQRVREPIGNEYQHSPHPDEVVPDSVNQGEKSM